MSDFKFEAWPTEHRKITQYFGVNPGTYAQFDLPGHDGIDIKAPKGSKIFAVAPGRVHRVQPVPDGKGYGIHVRINHIDGYETIYAHLEKTLVRVGNRVEAGTVIGLADSTGFSTGSHLHLVLKRQGETYQGWPYNITDPTPFLLPLLTWQKPEGPYTDGWVYEAVVTVIDDLAQVNTGDAHLREGAGLEAEIIDLIPAGTILIVNGEAKDGSLPVRVPSSALESSSVDFAPPEPTPDKPTPPHDVMLAWVWEEYLEITGKYAKVGRHGVNLRSLPNRDGTLIGKVQWGYMSTIVGPSINGYAPVFFYIHEVIDPRPDVYVQKPAQWPDNGQDAEDDSKTVRGWVLSSRITIDYLSAVVGRMPATVRERPRRNANILGFVAQGTKMRILGPPNGEYTPVRVTKSELQLPKEPSTEDVPRPEKEDPPEEIDPRPLGQALIGLHASADPAISESEISEFTLFRPGMIKILTSNDPVGVRRLAANHPQAKFIVRAFLDFGNRSLNPQRFFDDTISDMQRALNILRGRSVVIELHNEPNIYAEGLGSSWANGAEFATWWQRLLRLYRYVFPGYRFIFPGLSPGTDVPGVRQGHRRFLDACLPAVEAADGLGVHLYWSANSPMSLALDVLDNLVERFPDKPIYVTEASNNGHSTSPQNKAVEYLTFWNELQKRPTVEGVTYFIASSINPDFQHEVFLGKGMSRIIGAR